MRTRSRGFTVIELCVVIGITSILIGILLPVCEKVRHSAYIDTCASNLRQIGQALQIYANDNRGAFPRTCYMPGQPPVAGTGITEPNPFASTGPAPNDVSAAVYLLIRTVHLPPIVFDCPYPDMRDYRPERANPITQSNFTDYKLNLGYSIMNPYPDAVAVDAGYAYSIKVGAVTVVAADRNPGVDDFGRDDVTYPVWNSPRKDLIKANSENHEKEGENILFGDGHVEYSLSAFVGFNHDNMYTNRNNQILASPVDKNDAVLLPTD